MLFFEILTIAIGLSMDAFAVSIGAAASNRRMAPRATFRLSFHFGLFQYLMPIAGWLVGAEVAHLVASFAGWLAWALLTAVGGHMVYAGLYPADDTARVDPSRGVALVMLSVATSLDALAVGFSLAMLRMSIWYPAFVIGLITGTLSLVGVRLGARLGTRVGRPMEIAGGILLVGIGLRILLAGS
jgi:manganese efflux pump family protein